jgi:translation elongation factor EF-1alpha
VQASAAEVLQCLQEIATLFLNRLGECGLQSWAQASGIVHQTLLLKNYGLAQLRAELIECKPTTALVDQLITTGSTWASSPLVLPVCELRDGALAFREMIAQDVDHIVLLIDAVVATKAAPKVAYKPILNPSFPSFSTAANRAVGFKHNPIEWDETLPSVNVAFIGNVNSGKSSISGMLLSYLNIVPADVVSRLGQEAAKLGLPEALKHAWVMDTTSHERRGGFTIKPTWAGFQTPTRRYTIIDNPGHKDFCRNAAFGVFEADAVVLVMPADVFGQDPTAAVAESSAETKLLSAQAEEHLMTAFCFGVREIVVAVNKMDLVAYSQAAFENVRAVTQKMLKKAGFKPESAIFVPVSVADSDGFLQASDRASAWYTGPGLLQACDDLPQPKRIVDRPLRMVVDEVYQCKIKPNGQGSAILCGKIERGALSLQDTVSCYPFGPHRASVQSIQLHGTTTHEAKAGDNVGILVSIDAHAVRVAQGNRKVSPADVKAEQTPRKGCIVTLTSQPAVTVMHRFEAQLLVIRGTAFKVGYKPSLTTHIVTVSVHITKLVEIIGRNNVVLESNPTEVKAGQTVVCEMTALRPFAAETMHDMPRLSRFLIKEDRAITAMGVIRRVIS